jgi:hypothetical protein
VSTTTVAMPTMRPTPAQRVGEVQALAGVQQVADHQPDGQGDRRHQQEVAQGQTADPALAGSLPDGADAEHDGAEDDRAMSIVISATNAVPLT